MYNNIIADIDGVDQAEDAHGGVHTDLTDGAAQLVVGGLDDLAGGPRHQYLHKDKNEHSISNRGNIMHNVHVADNIDGVDQAPVAHGGDGVGLVDGAARLEVGGRGRGRPGGLAGELRHRYHLHRDKNEHNISNRGNIKHNVRVAVVGVDQAPVALGEDGVELVDGGARLEVGGPGRGRPGGPTGGTRAQYQLTGHNGHY